VNASTECPGDFSIANNGSIYTNKDLASGCQYNLFVMARDRGDPPRVGKCHVIITVKKSNASTNDKNTGSSGMINCACQALLLLMRQ